MFLTRRQIIEFINIPSVVKVTATVKATDRIGNRENYGFNFDH